MKLVRHGTGSYRAGGVIGPAQWAVHDLIAILEGSVVFETPRQGLRLAAGDAVIIPPGVRFHAFAGKHGGAIWVGHFQPGKSAEALWLRQGEVDTLWHFPLGVESPWAQAVLQQISELYPDAERRAECHLLLPLLLREIRASPRKPPDSPVQKALRWAEERGWKEVTLKSLAAQSGYSPSHFRALFQAENGSSVGAFLKARKLQTARQLLRDADRPIKEIASLLGYSDACAFHHAFTAAHGCTPGEYRRRNPGIV